MSDPCSTWRWSILCLVVCLAGCATGSGARIEEAEQPAGQKAEKRAKPAVGDFSLRDLKGNTVRLSDYFGKVVLVAFWATWCGPCHIELLQLQAILERHREKGFILLTVSVDTADKESEVRQFVRRYRYEFPVLLDQSSEVTDRFHPTMELPYSMLLDRKGRIAARHQGYRPGAVAGIEKKIIGLLSNQ